MKEYPEYLPKTDDEEAIFDQMVSIWAGRFTGKLKQGAPTFADEPELASNIEAVDLSSAS